MNDIPLVLWGASGHARVLQEFLPGLGYRLVALFDNDETMASPFAEVPIYHGEAGFARWREANSLAGVHGLVAVGGHRGHDRRQLQQLLQSHGIPAPVVVHPRAFVAASALLGAGTQVCALSAVCASASLGEACIVNTRSSVDHECSLRAGVHVAPGATLAGCVSIGENTLIGAGAVVLPRVSIGANCIVGAGSVVTRDIPERCMALGNPARVVRKLPPP